jgi:integrase/recombinase XerC
MTPFFVLNSFINFLQTEKRFSEHTVVAYKNDLKQFFEFIDIQKSEDLKEITHHLIRSWIVFLKDASLENKTINRKLATLRTFFRWTIANGIIENNPTIKIVGPKQKKSLPHFVQENELDSSKFETLFQDNFEGLRDQLMFEMFYQTGMRLSELIELRKENFGTSHVKVLGKRNKERVIPFSSELEALILKYKDSLQKMNINCISFFCLENGNKLYPKFVYRKINYYLSLITNLEVKSPHILRHTFATHMLNNGAGLETLKNLLGHSSLAATQVYTHNSFKQLTNIYSSAHPRGRKTL